MMTYLLAAVALWLAWRVAAWAWRNHDLKRFALYRANQTNNTRRMR